MAYLKWTEGPPLTHIAFLRSAGTPSEVRPSCPTASATATPTAASTAATRAPTPATSPTAATTSTASTTSNAAPTTTPAATSTTTAATSTTPAYLALAAAALRTSRSSPNVLRNRDVCSSSRGVGGGKGGGGASLKEGRARSATSSTYRNCTSLSCEEMLLEEVNNEGGGVKGEKVVPNRAKRVREASDYECCLTSRVALPCLSRRPALPVASPCWLSHRPALPVASPYLLSSRPALSLASPCCPRDALLTARRPALPALSHPAARTALLHAALLLCAALLLPTLLHTALLAGALLLARRPADSRTTARTALPAPPCRALHCPALAACHSSLAVRRLSLPYASP
ncbi:unnamed protein product [Closterium sp. NIES-54]